MTTGFQRRGAQSESSPLPELGGQGYGLPWRCHGASSPSRRCGCQEQAVSPPKQFLHERRLSMVEVQPQPSGRHQTQTVGPSGDGRIGGRRQGQTAGAPQRACAVALQQMDPVLVGGHRYGRDSQPLGPHRLGGCRRQCNRLLRYGLKKSYPAQRVAAESCGSSSCWGHAR